MAIESSLKNMVVSLSVICLVCSALLAGAYALTKAPIDAANAAKTTNAIRQVLPEFEGEPVTETVMVGDAETAYYSVSKGGEVIGYAITSSASGFNGAVTVMVGVTADGIIYNTAVLSQAETPGLGAKCVEPAFGDQFKNLDPAVTKLAVKKDGGDIDAITASTITSRAYIAAVNGALNIFKAITSGADVDAASGATVGASDWEEASSEASSAPASDETNE